MRGLVVAFAAVVGVLAAPAVARAAAPAVVHASAPDRHPVVTWSLPPDVEAEGVEVADKPDLGEDGQFAAANVWIGEAVDPAATSWTSLSTRLDPGVYYVHVTGWDDACLAADPPEDDPAAECDAHVVSPTVRLVVTNAPPQVRDVHYQIWGHTVYAYFTVCDDAAGRAVIIVRERKKSAGRTLARFTRGIQLDTRSGCHAYRVISPRQSPLGHGGRHSLTLQVLDYDGAFSNVATGERGPPAT